MPFELTNAQINNIKELFDNNKIADGYELLAKYGRSHVKDGGAEAAAILWLEGAADVNRGKGDASEFIRDYTSYQHIIRYGTALTTAQLTKISNEIGKNVLSSVIDSGKFITLRHIATLDAATAVEANFGGDAAAWSGNILFAALGDTAPFKDNILQSKQGTYDLFALVASTDYAAELQSYRGSIGASILNFAEAMVGNGYGFKITGAQIAAKMFGANALLTKSYGTSLSLASLINSAYSDNLWVGSYKSDKLKMTDVSETAHGGKGGDRIWGNGGDDFIEGGAGNDIIVGGRGKDRLYGGADNDIFRFAPGDVVKGEVVDGGASTGEGNRLSGYGSINFGLAKIKAVSELRFEEGGKFTFKANQISESGISPRSKVFASEGADQLLFKVGTQGAGGSLDLSGLRFDSRFSWSSSDEIVLNGSVHADTIMGTSMADTFRFISAEYANGDVIKGGKGTDVVEFSGGTDMSGLSFESIEVFKFKSAGRVSFGEQKFGKVVFVGTTGEDRLDIQSERNIDLSGVTFKAVGEGRFQTSIVGDYGDQTIKGTRAHDYMIGGNGSDVIRGGAGDDQIWGDADTWYLGGNFDNDVLYGDAGDDWLYGNSGSDRLYGGSGNDWMDGGPGADVLTGGEGSDIFQTRLFSLTSEVDRFLDFSHAQGDKINIDSGPHGSKPVIKLYTGKVPTDLDSEFLYYKRSSGELYIYNSPILSGDIELLAILENKPKLVQGDFDFW